MEGDLEWDLDGDSKGDFRGDFKQDMEGDLLSSSGKVRSRSGLVQVWLSIQPKFTSFELDSEVGRLVLLGIYNINQLTRNAHHNEVEFPGKFHGVVAVAKNLLEALGPDLGESLWSDYSALPVHQAGLDGVLKTEDDQTIIEVGEKVIDLGAHPKTVDPVSEQCVVMHYYNYLVCIF